VPIRRRVAGAGANGLIIRTLFCIPAGDEGVFHKAVQGDIGPALAYPETTPTCFHGRSPSEVFMSITKVLAGASLLLLVLALAPMAQAQHDGNGMSSRPSKMGDPSKNADRQVKRKEQRDMQRQQRGSAPTMQSRPPSN
jgi:hypothetical protein